MRQPHGAYQNLMRTAILGLRFCVRAASAAAPAPAPIAAPIALIRTPAGRYIKDVVEPRTEPVPAWCLRMLSELQAADARAIALAKTLTSTQLNWKPRPDAWSIGQCLEHLCVANDVYLPPISDALQGRNPAMVQDIRPGWLGRWFIRNYIEPSPETKRVRAPRKIAPGARIESSILERFLRSNEVARDVVRRAASYDVNRIRFRNPFIPALRFSVGTGLEVLTTHERRHLLQAERVRESSEFPVAAPMTG